MGSSRRSFLRDGLAAGLNALAPEQREPEQPAPDTPPPVRGTEADIDHLVVLIRPGDSFDHRFGSLRGVRGLDDAVASESVQAPDEPAPAEPEPTPAPRSERPLTRIDAAFDYALADAFTICDAYHCVPGDREANLAALLDGATATPIAELLAAAAHGQLPDVAWALLGDDDAAEVAAILTVVAERPEQWARTAVLITHVDAGGHDDHVDPPPGAGPRVPLVVVSPFTRGGYVYSEPLGHHAIPHVSATFTYPNPAKLAVKNLPNPRIPVPPGAAAAHHPPQQEPGTRPTVAEARPPLIGA